MRVKFPSPVTRTSVFTVFIASGASGGTTSSDSVSSLKWISNTNSRCTSATKDGSFLWQYEFTMNLSPLRDGADEPREQSHDPFAGGAARTTGPGRQPERWTKPTCQICLSGLGYTCKTKIPMFFYLQFSLFKPLCYFKTFPQPLENLPLPLPSLFLMPCLWCLWKSELGGKKKKKKRRVIYKCICCQARWNLKIRPRCQGKSLPRCWS